MPLSAGAHRASRSGHEAGVMAPLRISVEESPGGEPLTIVSVSGRGSITESAPFRRVLDLQAARARGRLVIDLSGLLSLDWWTALILLWVGEKVTRRGAILVLAGPRPGVARMLESAGVSRVIPVRDSVQRARHLLDG